MILALFCCLFVFLGMFIGNKIDFKKMSISMVFGLFLINMLISIIPNSYDVLYKNYHSSTIFYLLLGSILGFLVMKLISFKYDETDNISIAGFCFFNSYLLVLSRFNIFFLIVNILYYILIGIYIRDSRSWISVIVGCFIGILFSLLSGWFIGYFLTIIIGFLAFYLISVYSVIIKNGEKSSYIGLIIGLVLAFLGGVL